MLKQIGIDAASSSRFGAPLSYRLTVSAMTLCAASTAIMGAFVSGNEAGLVYNEWPRMGLGFIPSDLFDEHIQPAWRNMFEHPTYVQFQHRLFAYTTVLLLVGTAATALRATPGALTP